MEAEPETLVFAIAESTPPDVVLSSVTPHDWEVWELRPGSYVRRAVCRRCRQRGTTLPSQSGHCLIHCGRLSLFEDLQDCDKVLEELERQRMVILNITAAEVMNK